MGFGLIGPTPYSRESTPDSGGSHYIDNFRDPNGECEEEESKKFFLFCFADSTDSECFHC